MSKSFSVNSWLSLAFETDHNGIEMRLIGYWSDLVAYYQGSDQNAWAFHYSGRSWVNQGPESEFRARLLAGKIRGKLIS